MNSSITCIEFICEALWFQSALLQNQLYIVKTEQDAIVDQAAQINT